MSQRTLQLVNLEFMHIYLLMVPGPINSYYGNCTICYFNNTSSLCYNYVHTNFLYNAKMLLNMADEGKSIVHDIKFSKTKSAVFFPTK